MLALSSYCIERMFGWKRFKRIPFPICGRPHGMTMQHAEQADNAFFYSSQPALGSLGQFLAHRRSQTRSIQYPKSVSAAYACCFTPSSPTLAEPNCFAYSPRSATPFTHFCAQPLKSLWVLVSAWYFWKKASSLL